jgi:FKBP-type peptidyl-prolyl cis-trans isomerase FkpA
MLIPFAASALPLGSAPKLVYPRTMRRSYLLALPIALAMLLSSCNSTPSGSGGAAKLDNDESKTIYALGLSIGHTIEQFNLTPAELEIVKQGMTDNMAKKPAADIEVYGPKIDDLLKGRRAKLAESEKGKAKAYEDKMAAVAGAQRTPSGLIYKDITVGTGASPKDSDIVKVNYKGTLTDGTEFDSSAKHNNTPLEIPLGGVIPCWTEGVQKMKVGGKAQLICPAAIAYGDAGSPPVPPGATLTFEIELLGIGASDATKK